MADHKDIGSTVNNIGAVYYTMAMYPAWSSERLLEALKIYEKFNIKDYLSYSLGNIGDVYSDMGKFDEASKYFLLALKIEEESGDKNMIATTRIKIADMNIL